MAAAGEEVKVYGMWASPFVRRVQLALKVKGIPYQYVEESLVEKSQELLQYNPVHKRVPVLVHNGNPISESLVIVEYIEDTWKVGSPSLLPDDPYQLANVRFWANFIDLKLVEQLRTVLLKGTEEEKKKMRENLDMLEGSMSHIFPAGTPPTCVTVGEKESMGLLDILMCTFSGVVEAIEEALGEKFVDPNKHPLTVTWMKAFDGLPIVKETTPSHDNMVGFFKHFGSNKK